MYVFRGEGFAKTAKNSQRPETRIGGEMKQK
jgi:hypothetical protein